MGSLEDMIGIDDEPNTEAYIYCYFNNMFSKDTPDEDRYEPVAKRFNISVEEVERIIDRIDAL